MIIAGPKSTQPLNPVGVILSNSAKYALRAALCLSEAEGGRPVSVDEIAQRTSIPRNYLSKILHELARSGILESTRGPSGGFGLARPAAELSLADIVREFDEIPEETSCLLDRDECTADDPCPAHHRWVAVREQLVDFLQNTRLADLSAEAGPCADLAVEGSAR